MFSVKDTKMMSSFEMQSAPVLATTKDIRTIGKMASKKQTKLKKGDAYASMNARLTGVPSATSQWVILVMVGKLFLFMCNF